MTLSEIIRNIEFFSGLDQKTLRRIEEEAIVCQFESGETIVKEGELGLGMYVVISGKLEVSKKIPSGNLKLAELGPSQFFAEMSLIDDKPRSATVTTLETAECLLLTRDSFLKLIEKSPQVAVRMARVLAARLRVAGDAQVATHTTSVPAAVPSENKVPAAPAGPLPGSAKAVVHEQLMNAFGPLYSMKAMTRFSVAVLGCPVEGSALNAIDEIRIGEIKIFLLPADEPVELSISAYGAGEFNLDVFHPDVVGPIHFGPVGIREEDSFRLSLPRFELSSLTSVGGV